MTTHRPALPEGAGGAGDVGGTGTGATGGQATGRQATGGADAAMAAAALSRRGLRRVLVVLCVTQVVSWGALYYAFPVLAPTIGADTGWSTGAVTGAFSVSLAVSALVGVPVGRLLDRWGPRPVMTAGSVLAGPALVAIATARSPLWFLTGWSLAGVAMAGTLYQPAFAALTRWWGPRRVTALTGLTLVGGLASTVSAPLVATLVGHLGWRRTYLVLAVGLVAITVPAHAVGLAGRWPQPESGPDGVPWYPDQPGSVARSRAFLLLATAVSLAALAVNAAVINLVPLLTGRGLSTGVAALALGLVGVGQVCGRIGYRRLADGLGVRSRTAVVLGASASSIALLSVLPGPAWALLATAMLAGATRGLLTLVNATAISDRWGTTTYGRLNGLLSAPVQLAASSAPWVGTMLAGALGGYPVAFTVLAGTGALGALLACGTAPGRVPLHPAAGRRGRHGALRTG